jgi:hypothetical protein
MSKYAWVWLVCFTILLIRPSQNAPGEPVDSVVVQSATTHMQVRDNRAFILLQAIGTNGRKKTVLFWVDSGGDSVFWVAHSPMNWACRGSVSRFRRWAEDQRIVSQNLCCRSLG